MPRVQVLFAYITEVQGGCLAKQRILYKTHDLTNVLHETPRDFTDRDVSDYDFDSDHIEEDCTCSNSGSSSGEESEVLTPLPHE